jgi:hypothetical protein
MVGPRFRRPIDGRILEGLGALVMAWVFMEDDAWYVRGDDFRCPRPAGGEQVEAAMRHDERGPRHDA